MRKDHSEGEPVPGAQDEKPPLNLAPTPWADLDVRSRRRVELLLGSLADVEAAMQHSERLRPPNANHPLVRFIVHGLICYVVGFYLGGSTGAQDVLRSVNLSELADEVDECLARSVGGHTVGSYLTEEVNTLIRHPSFDPKHYLRRVMDKFGLPDEEAADAFKPHFNDLLQTTRTIHIVLRKVYPLAAASEDSRWKESVDNPDSSDS